MPPSSPWLRIPKTASIGSPARPTSSSRAGCPFIPPIEGPNSFRNSAEYKTSLVGTLYTALRRNRSIRYNTDLIFDLEAPEAAA